MDELVSIVMPSYNTGRFISEAIESVLLQTYKNWELIIVDDNSTDNTESVVQTYRDERIKYMRNDKNEGAAFCRNRALRAAKGRWIAFLDSDDLWLPHKLERQISFMQDNQYYFSYTKYSEINEDGSSCKTIVSGPKVISKNGFYNYCWPGCLTVMYDQNAIGSIQIKNIKKNNDYAMWLKVCQKADCYLLDEVLAKYRRGRTGSISTTGYLKLVSWHYKLFREADGKSVIVSACNTGRNLVFGLYKKMRYVSRGK